jgi:hypothetical protein
MQGWGRRRCAGRSGGGVGLMTQSRPDRLGLGSMWVQEAAGSSDAARWPGCPGL